MKFHFRWPFVIVRGYPLTILAFFLCLNGCSDQSFEIKGSFDYTSYFDPSKTASDYWVNEYKGERIYVNIWGDRADIRFGDTHYDLDLVKKGDILFFQENLIGLPSTAKTMYNAIYVNSWEIPEKQYRINISYNPETDSYLFFMLSETQNYKFSFSDLSSF